MNWRRNRFRFLTHLACGAALAALSPLALAADADPVAAFTKDVKPILEENCFDCHADGAKKGGVSFDVTTTQGALVQDHELWAKVLKNVRAGLMPPAKKKRLPAEDVKRLEEWVKYGAFALDPKLPDPGRVTVRRLNRAEYRNTIRDLIGVDYKTEEEFPSDDSGYGFDNIADVLTVSPILLEKYVDAATQIVNEAVPETGRVMPEQVVLGKAFTKTVIPSEAAPAKGQAVANGATEKPAATSTDAGAAKVEGAKSENAKADAGKSDGAKADVAKADAAKADAAKAEAGAGSASPDQKRTPKPEDAALTMSYYESATASATLKVKQSGGYLLALDMTIRGNAVENNFDNNRIEFAFSADGKELLRKEYGWDEKKELKFELPAKLDAGDHKLTLDVKRVSPPDTKQTANLKLTLNAVKLLGPQEKEYWVRPKNYEKFFGAGIEGISDAAKLRDAARNILRPFASKAYRHPVDEPTVDRLVSLAESVYGGGKKTFEAGIRQAMVAVLASPRFLFREEGIAPAEANERYPHVDEYSLASRLSYFLWSSMPDDELLRLAGSGELRKNLPAQVKRMMADPRAEALTKNFVGQWLQVRDVEGVQIDARRVANRDTLQQVRLVTDRDRRDTRVAMRKELESYFQYVVKEDRSVLELIDSGYTFLDERLANYYGVPDVKGDEMRRVTLPADSPRGGVLTMGSVLLVTSNPTRTSPVKRGLFLLENVLGTPTPPPPPDIPSLEASGQKFKDKVPTLRETLAVHREAPLCSSCHNRMDPLGLAFENFSALGIWRDKEVGQPIDASGKLITGEAFTTVRELKHILATDRKQDFYRCLTEKLLIYALGRGLEYYDVETVDQIVSSLDRDGGKFSTLLSGVIDSSPFQRRRGGLDDDKSAANVHASAAGQTKEATATEGVTR